MIPWLGGAENMKASRFSDAQKGRSFSSGVLMGPPVRPGSARATYFNWKRKYDGLLPIEMRRLKQLNGTPLGDSSTLGVSRTTARSRGGWRSVGRGEDQHQADLSIEGCVQGGIATSKRARPPVRRLLTI
jgi:hypothetical protein